LFLELDMIMQKIIVKDLLKVLFEKCHNLKNILIDRNRIHQVEIKKTNYFIKKILYCLRHLITPH